MKDYLEQSKWWNRPLANPTQTAYMRFLKGPGAKFGTMFDKSVEEFEKRMNSPIGTMYTDLLEIEK